MNQFSLMDLVKQCYSRNGGGFSYTIYYDGRPLTYKDKALYLFDRKTANGVEPTFFTFSKVPENKTQSVRDFIRSDDETLNRIFHMLLNNVVEFRYGREQSSRYSFNKFISSLCRDDQFRVTILNAPRIIWISSPIYDLLTNHLRKAFPAGLSRVNGFDDDEHKIGGNPREFELFVATLRCMLYKNYIDFVQTTYFARTFKQRSSFFFYSLPQAPTFTILSVRYVGEGRTLFNPIFDDKEMFSKLKANTRVYEKYFLVPKEDRDTEYKEEQDMLLEESVDDFRVLFMDHLTLSRVLGLKNKFHFTPYTAAVFLMGSFVMNPFTDMIPEFANSRSEVYMLADTAAKEQGYSDFVSKTEYAGMSPVDQSMYQKITTLQMFVGKNWDKFKKLGFSNLNRVLAASEVRIQ